MRVVAQNLSPELTLVEKVWNFNVYIECFIIWRDFVNSFSGFGLIMQLFLQGDDTQPWMCKCGFNTTWSFAYNAWWKIPSPSCFGWRYYLINSLPLKKDKGSVFFFFFEVRRWWSYYLNFSDCFILQMDPLLLVLMSYSWLMLLFPWYLLSTFLFCYRYLG